MAPATPPAPRRSPRRPPGSRLLRGFVVLVAVVGLVAAGWWLRTGEVPPSRSRVPARDLRPAPRTVPTPGNEESDAPLGTPPPAPDSDGYAFVARQDDGTTPVAYDPCRPVAVVLSPDGAPADAEPCSSTPWPGWARSPAAVPVRGHHRRAARRRPEAYQPDRYGDRWAPVLVGWRTPDQEPGLAGDVAGLGGSASAGPEGGPLAWVTGSVTLDGPEASASSRPRGRRGGPGDPAARARPRRRAGARVGLRQLMASTTTGEVLDFADGDLAGLAQLGAGVCIPEL